MSPLRCICAALLCFVPVAGIFAAQNKVHAPKAVNPVVGDFAIIGMYGHNSFIIDSGAMIAFVPEKQFRDKTRNWKMGDVIRQTVLQNTSKCELKNLTTGDVAQAEPISLSGYRYQKGRVGKLKVRANTDEGLFLADFKHYKIVNYTPANAAQWKQDDLVSLYQTDVSKRSFVLKNLTSGAKAEAVMTNPFKG